MTISFWQADDTQPVREVDCLVVGAGITGAASAYYLAQAGRDVTVIDKHDVAMGASGRNAGFMITGLDTYYHRAADEYGHEVAQEMWQLSRQTIDSWRRIAERYDVPLENCGSMLLAESEREANDLADAAQALADAGIDVIFHERDPLGRGYHAAIEQPADAAVQPYRLTQAVLAASGAVMVPNCEVYRMEQTAPDSVTVYTSQAIFKAQYVMLCTNAYSPQIDPYFADKITPTRAQCLVTEPLPEPVMQTCGYSNYGYMYYRMTFDGRFLIGGGRHTQVALEHDTTEDRVNPLVQDELDAYMRRYFPEINVPVARRWSGIMGFSVDGLPLVGRLPEQSRVGFAVGFTGHGLALGAGTAERAVNLLLHDDYAGTLDARRLDAIVT